MVVVRVVHFLKTRRNVSLQGQQRRQIQTGDMIIAIVVVVDAGGQGVLVATAAAAAAVVWPGAGRRGLVLRHIDRDALLLGGGAAGGQLI